MVSLLETAIITGFFTLGGVAVGAVLIPYVETRWARRLRAHQIRLDTLVELHDTFDQWVETVPQYRSVRVVFLEHGKSLATEALLEYNRVSQEHTRLQNRIYALLARLDDKELGTTVSHSILAVLALLQDDNIHDVESIQSWMIEASGSVSSRIGKTVATARLG